MPGAHNGRGGKGWTDVGRIVVFLLLVVLVVPAVLLWRQWRAASARRQINEGTLAFVVSTADAEKTLARWPQRARQVRRLGLVLGLAGIIVLALRFGTVSVFLWPPVLGFALLLGTLAGELVRPRPLWARTARSGGNLADHIDPGLVWWLRGSAVLALVVGIGAALRSRPGVEGRTIDCVAATGVMDNSGTIVAAASGVAGTAVLAWALAEATLQRVLRLPAAVEFDDVPLDETLRSARAHAGVAAATALVLLPLGGFAVVAGLTIVDNCADSDLVGTGLVAGGLAAVLAGLSVAAFVPSWVRAVQVRADVRS